MKRSKRKNENTIITGYSFLSPVLLVIAAISIHFGWLFLKQYVEPSTVQPYVKFAEDLPLVLYLCAVTVVVIIITQFIAVPKFSYLSPAFVRQVTSTIVWTIAIGVLAGNIFDIPVGSIVTTSGMVVAVVGIAVRSLISDAITGLTLPIKIGDAIDTIEEFPSKGRVVEIGWRAVKLITEEMVTIVVPNSHLVNVPLRNYSQPEPYYIDFFRVVLPVVISSNQARRNLLAAARQVETIAKSQHVPEVRIVEFNKDSVEWEIRYMVPSAENAPDIRFNIQSNLLRNLHFSGIVPTYEQSVASIQRGMEPGHIHNEVLFFLSNVDLFGSMTNDELKDICQHVSQKLVREGKSVVCRGDEGNSLFIVREGLLHVKIEIDGVEKVVGQVAPGHFFGEMSLLTGAPRSATVTTVVDSLIYEISHAVLMPVIQNRKEIAERMSRVLAERQSANRPRQNTDEAEEEAKQFLAAEFLSSIVAFFRL